MCKFVFFPPKFKLSPVTTALVAEELGGPGEQLGSLRVQSCSKKGGAYFNISLPSIVLICERK